MLGVFGVGGGITNDTVDEAAEDITDFTVDGTSDALDTTTAGEAADARPEWPGSGLGDALDVVACGTRVSAAGPCGASWRRPCRVLFRLYHVQTCWFGLVFDVSSKDVVNVKSQHLNQPKWPQRAYFRSDSYGNQTLNRTLVITVDTEVV